MLIVMDLLQISGLCNFIFITYEYYCKLMAPWKMGNTFTMISCNEVRTVYLICVGCCVAAAALYTQRDEGWCCHVLIDPCCFCLITVLLYYIV